MGRLELGHGGAQAFLGMPPKSLVLGTAGGFMGRGVREGSDAARLFAVSLVEGPDLFLQAAQKGHELGFFLRAGLLDALNGGFDSGESLIQHGTPLYHGPPVRRARGECYNGGVSDEPVTLKIDGAVARLTLNRPAALNALDQTEADAFSRAVKTVARGKTRVLLLSGAGRAFCAGGDLAFIEGNTRLSAPVLRRRMRRFYASFLGLRALPQATVARVHGPAIGAGLCLAMACDLRTVLSSARLAFNFTRLGLSPGMAAWPLARAGLGEARAKELLFTGRSFTGKDLHSWGAAAACEETEAALDQATERLAAELAGVSVSARERLKAETRLDDLTPYLEFEARAQAETFRLPDLREGLAAVKERRPPKF